MTVEAAKDAYEEQEKERRRLADEMRARNEEAKRREAIEEANRLERRVRDVPQEYRNRQGM